MKKTISSFIYLSCFSFSFIASQHAIAGADTSCYSSTEIQTNEYTACNNLPVLSPANDNRTNMLLLLSDLGLAKLSIENDQTSFWTTQYSQVPFATRMLTNASTNQSPSARQKTVNEIDPYQEHCSTLKQGEVDFIQQVRAEKKLSQNEKTLLIQARKNIKDCENKPELLKVDSHWSPTARQFASYLNGIISFYNTNFSTATKIFSALKTVDQPWIKETSHYMLIRSSLNEAYQSGVGEYGDLDRSKIKQPLLTDFFNHITQYLKLYPKGKYVASARGALRRGYWLSDRQDLLISEYIWQINNPKSPFYNLEINNLPLEIDRHIFQYSDFNAKNLKDPFLFSIHALMKMRKPETDDEKYISWNELNASKDVFKAQPALFQYLQANHLYFVQHKPREALKYLPEHQPNSMSSHLQVSQILLKGRILESLNPSPSNQQYWEHALTQSSNTIQRGLFEFMLYPYYSKQQLSDRFIGKNAKIKQAMLQKDFITTHANEASLMNVIRQSPSTEQKNVALFTLLNKSLTHQNYALFNQAFKALPANAAQFKYSDAENAKYNDHPPLSTFLWKGNLISPNIKCPTLSALTQQLEKMPNDLALQLCLGEFIRSDQGYYTSSQTITEQQTPSFKGSIFTRGQVYKNIMRSNLNDEYKAYALFRSIQCYAPSGTNDCQDAEVSKSVRKQWFDQIKKNYPNSTWAKSLKFYW